ISNVMLVTLLTSALVITCAPDPGCFATTKANMRLPIPEQYGMMSVPSTVPSSPPAFIASSRQSISSDAATNTTTNNNGAHGPWLSIDVTSEFKTCSKSSGQGDGEGK